MVNDLLEIFFSKGSLKSEKVMVTKDIEAFRNVLYKLKLN